MICMMTTRSNNNNKVVDTFSNKIMSLSNAAAVVVVIGAVDGEDTTEDNHPGSVSPLQPMPIDAATTTTTQSRQDVRPRDITTTTTSTAAVVPEGLHHRYGDDCSPQQQQQQQQDELLLSTLFYDKDWQALEALIEFDPSLASRTFLPLTLQGEDIRVLPLAAIAACQSRNKLHRSQVRHRVGEEDIIDDEDDNGIIPMSLFEALVTAYPKALLQGDARTNRIPLMIAIMTLHNNHNRNNTGQDEGETSSSSPASAAKRTFANHNRNLIKMKSIRYLFESWCPHVLQHVDGYGNVALHYAAQYWSSMIHCGGSCGSNQHNTNTSHKNNNNNNMFAEMLMAYPQAAQIANHKQQLPMHLLVSAAVTADDVVVASCSCCNSNNKMILRSLNMLLQAYPEALQCRDRRGRLPLHVACTSSSYPSFEVLQLLIQHYPEALITPDGCNNNNNSKIPLEYWIMMSSSSLSSPQKRGIVGSVAGLSSLRISSQRNKAKRSKALLVLKNATSCSMGGSNSHTIDGCVDNDVVLAYLQECTRREQKKKKKKKQNASSSGSTGWLGRRQQQQRVSFFSGGGQQQQRGKSTTPEGTVVGGQGGVVVGGKEEADDDDASSILSSPNGPVANTTSSSTRKRDSAIMATFANCYG